LKRLVTITLLVYLPAIAFAGGLEFPGNGTEALGRGTAFTAKADDATAFDYNVAGFARQRGTRMLLDLNLVFHRYEFQRAGAYPDDPNDPATPWGGKPFPKVQDTGPPFAAPYFGLSTDFGVLDRWTFALGLFGPSSVGNRTYPLGIGGQPSPARYDVVQATPLVLLPSLAVAVRLARWLDFGVALHVPIGRFDLASVSFTDVSQAVCKNPEYQPCDALNQLHTIGATATASFGALVRPARFIAFGVNARAPYTISSSGTVHPTAPSALNLPLMDAPASFKTSFPWIVRGGLRFIYMKGTHEAADLEFDATWEGWSHVADPQVSIPSLGPFNDLTPTIVHNYRDSYSLRVGGAINTRLPVGVLSFRLGAFYDSSSTAPKDTRLDFDTLDKIAITGGLGYRVRGVSFNLAYAYFFENGRTVTDGDIAPINGAQHGQSVDAMGNALPPVNNGTYTANTQVLSLGMTIAWDEAVKSERVVAYHADYEEGAPEATRSRPAVPATEEEPQEEGTGEEPAGEAGEASSAMMTITPEEAAAIEARQAKKKRKKSKKRHRSTRRSSSVRSG
jgi:long-subunit fatty acid transport protein